MTTGRAESETVKFGTPFGSMFLHVARAPGGAVANVQIDHQMKDPDARVAQLIEAINAALRELCEGNQAMTEASPRDEFVGAALPLAESDLLDAADALGVELACIKAVMEVESNGVGFLPDKRPVILFESYQFHRLTEGRFDATHPAVSQPKRVYDYKGGAAEYERLQEAIALDRRAALKAASWGRFQIMGFNHVPAGFSFLDEFVRAMCASERNHLFAFTSFIQVSGLVGALRNKDWHAFARGYNGPGYAADGYHVKLERAYHKHSVGP